MMRFLTAAAAAAATLAAPAGTSAERELFCLPPEQMTPYLGAQYQEVPIAVGQSDGGWGVVFYLSGERDTWTIVVVGSDKACIADAGRGWRPVRPRPAEEPGS